MGLCTACESDRNSLSGDSFSVAAQFSFRVREIYRIRTAVGTSPKMRLAARSYHRDPSTMSDYCVWQQGERICRELPSRVTPKISQASRLRDSLQIRSRREKETTVGGGGEFITLSRLGGLQPLTNRASQHLTGHQMQQNLEEPKALAQK